MTTRRLPETLPLACHVPRGGTWVERGAFQCERWRVATTRSAMRLRGARRASRRLPETLPLACVILRGLRRRRGGGEETASEVGNIPPLGSSGAQQLVVCGIST